MRLVDHPRFGLLLTVLVGASGGAGGSEVSWWQIALWCLAGTILIITGFQWLFRKLRLEVTIRRVPPVATSPEADPTAATTPPATPPTPQPAAAPTAAPTGTAAWLTGPPIPIPAYQVAIRTQPLEVFLAIVNGSVMRTFRGQVVGIKGASNEIAAPWGLTWRDGGAAPRTLAPKETQLLLIGAGDGMGNTLEKPRPTRLLCGLFRLPMPDGSTAVAEPVKANLSDFALQDHLFELQVRIFCDGNPSDYLVRLGFLNENAPNGNLSVRASVVDWSAR